ncbi:hypothetical protein KKC91_02285 [bacterium]|nr:hypothetical protein [bacterium]
MNNFIKNVTLEMSLKPFKDNSETAVRSACRELFLQWLPLIRHADIVSILLWSSDGSEILEYDGNLDRNFEWAKYIGVANPRCTDKSRPYDPDNISIHRHPYLYRENPPEFTYGWLKDLVGYLKLIGTEVTCKQIRVGATFDPGPEFAKSTFKYEKHPEICIGNTMGQASFVCCYSTLKKDQEVYAGFPEGIPHDTPFGTFLGRQCRHFLGDLGFDYVWFSNGFGFGMETWGICGAVFDGKSFLYEKCKEIRENILLFWKLFRKECPDIPIETRGTNLSTGMDLASDAVPLQDIYNGGYGVEPPPNSPWAALNGDFGLELAGWMSHIAELPDESFPFRFYTHDPWFLSSPWLDHYDREPHDIYLPLSIARLNREGRVCTPTSIEFLTVDDSYGNMPGKVPNEVIPHILEAKEREPDQAGPLVWVYPFSEYHEMTFNEPNRIKEVFFGDWFIRGAINNGFPLNTVVSTGNFTSIMTSIPEYFMESILITPIHGDNSKICPMLLKHLQNGGRILFYGPIEYANESILKLLNLQKTAPISGDLELSLNLETDKLSEHAYPTKLKHDELLSGGGLRAALREKQDPYSKIIAVLNKDKETRIAAISRSMPDWKGGKLAWVRGVNSFTLNARHPVMFDPAEVFHGELLMRFILAEFGYEIQVKKCSPDQRNPVITVTRHKNGFFFSCFAPDTTVALSLRFPQGAPLFKGMETRLINGSSTYFLPRALCRECRVFIEQEEDSLIFCKEEHSGHVGVYRRFLLSGLKKATVRFYNEPGMEANVKMLRNPKRPFIVGNFAKFRQGNKAYGQHLVTKNISGELLISW